MAKRFKFPLETLLKVRRRVEDQRKQALASEVQELNRLRADARDLDGQIAAALDVARQAATGPEVDARLLARQRYWIAHLQGGILDNHRKAADVEGRVEQRRQELAEAARDVKVVESLRNKALQRHEQALSKAEAAMLDELAIQQYRRRRAS